MKVLLTALAAGLLAGTLGAFLAMNRDDDNGSLDRADSERLSALEDRCERLEDELRDTRNRMVSRDDLAQALNGLNVRGELDALRQKVARTQSGAPEASGKERIAGTNEEDLVDAIEARLEERRRLEREQRQADREEKARVWARAKNRNRAQSLAKKFQLNEDQTTRLAEAMTTRDEANNGLWGAMKSDEASADDRLDAIRQWRENRASFEQSARGFLSQDQADSVIGSIQNEEQKVGDWLDGVEAELTGTSDNR